MHGCLTDEIVTEEERRKDIIRFKVGGNLFSYSDEKRLVKPENTVWNCIFRRELIEKNSLHFYAFIDYEDDYNFLMDAIQTSERIMTSEKGWYVYAIANADSESHTGKYIPNFKERFLESQKWADDKLNWAGLTKTEKTKATAEYTMMLILWGLFNASWREPFSYRAFSKEMKDISSCIDKTLYSKMIPRGRTYKIFLFLFQSSNYRLAGLLNRKIFLRRYH